MVASINRSGVQSRRAVRSAATAVVEGLESRVLMSASTLDTLFGALHNGKVTQNISGNYDSANAVKILPDGRVLVAGTDGTNFALARFKADGTPDPTFGAGTGKVTTRLSPAGGKLADIARAIALLPAGKFLIAGQANGDFALARYNVDGTLDKTFGASHTGIVMTDFAGKTGDSATSIAVQGDGKIILDGQAQNSAGGFDIALARYTAAGVLDTTFGPAHTGKITQDLAGQADAGWAVSVIGGGKILVAATVTWSDGKGVALDSDFGLLRFTSSGLLDTTFAKGSEWGPGIQTTDFNPSATAFSNDYVSDMSVCCCGEIVIGGTTQVSTDSKGNPIYDFAVAKYKADGTLDTTFNKTGKATIDFGTPTDIGRSVQLLSNDKVLVTGSTVIGTGTSAVGEFALARLNANGTLDTTFAPGGKTTTHIGATTYDDAHGLSVAANGNFVIAGTSSNDFSVARYLGDPNIGPHVCGGHLTHKPAATPGASIGGNLTADDGVDLYPITVAAGQTLGFDVDATAGSLLDSYIRLFDPAGNELAFNDNGKPAGKTTGSAGESYLSYKFPVAGTYYIGVSNSLNTYYDFATGLNAFDGSTGAYVLSVNDLGTGGVDNNDQISEAVAVAIGSSTAGAIANSTDVNVYKVAVAAGQRLGFSINLPAGATLNSFLRVFNSAGTELIYNDNGAAPGKTVGFGSYAEFTFSAAGTYYIGVSSSLNYAYNVVTGTGDVAGSIGAYTLVVTNITNFVDTNNKISDASLFTVGSVVDDMISFGLDVNLYKFTATAGETLAFDINLIEDSTLDSYLRIFNSSGAVIAYNNDGAAPGEVLGKASYISYTFTTAGTYYVGVSSYPNINYSVIYGTGGVSGGTGVYSIAIGVLSNTVDNNDQISEAGVINVNSFITDIISSPTDVNVYKFAIPAGATLGFDINLTSGSTLDSYIRIFDGSGNLLTFNNDGAAPGEVLGKSSYVTYTFATGGTYYIAVSGNGNTNYNVITGTGDTAGSTGGYTLDISNLTNYTDTNDQISEATSVLLGYVISDSIAFATDVNLYKFSVTAGEQISFNINLPAGKRLDSYLRIFDGSGNMLAFNNDGAGPGETLGKSSYLTYTFNTGGTYYIGVSGYANTGYNAVTGAGDVAGATGAYNLAITNITTSGDPNDLISDASAIFVNSIVTDAISSSTDVNVYRFTVTAGQKIGFDINLTNGSALDSYLRIFDGNGNQLAFNNDGAAPGETLGKSSYLVYTFTTAGTYYVGVSGYANTGYNVITGAGDVAGSTGGYALAVTDLTTDNDPNDQISEATAITVGQTVSDSISTTTDVNMYKFTVGAGHRIGFNVNGAGDTYLRVFDGNGSELAYNDDGAAPGETLGKSAYVEYTFLATGTYYVAVSGGGNHAYSPVTGLGDTPSTTGAYTLNMQYVGENDPDDQISEAHSLAIGATATDTINTNVDVDVYGFTASAGHAPWP